MENLEKLENVETIKGEMEYKNTVSISFHCKHCGSRHKLDLPNDLFENTNFPVSYAYLHGEPLIIATIYIDANFKVRSVDYTNDFSVSENQLSTILSKNKNLSLTSIPMDLIYALQLSEGKKIIKLYHKEGFSKIVNFSDVLKIWKLSERINKKKQSLNEFYIKYSDYWISGLEFADYRFILIIDTSIDIDHLKTQMMELFESILS